MAEWNKEHNARYVREFNKDVEILKINQVEILEKHTWKSC
jgi:hypothetical protein